MTDRIGKAACIIRVEEALDAFRFEIRGLKMPTQGEQIDTGVDLSRFCSGMRQGT